MIPTSDIFIYSGGKLGTPFASSGSFETGDDGWIITSTAGRAFMRRAANPRTGTFAVSDNSDGSFVSGYGRKTFARDAVAGLRIAASIWAARFNLTAATYLRAYGTKPDGSYGVLTESAIDPSYNQGEYRQLAFSFKYSNRPLHDLLIEFSGGPVNYFDDWSIAGSYT